MLPTKARCSWWSPSTSGAGSASSPMRASRRSTFGAPVRQRDGQCSGTGPGRRGKASHVLYMLLIYGDPSEAPPEAQSQEHMQRWFDYTNELQAAGALKGGDALQMPDTATTVRVRNDETLLTDGPFA